MSKHDRPSDRSTRSSLSSSHHTRSDHSEASKHSHSKRRRRSGSQASEPQRNNRRGSQPFIPQGELDASSVQKIMPLLTIPQSRVDPQELKSVIMKLFPMSEQEYSTWHTPITILKRKMRDFFDQRDQSSDQRLKELLDGLTQDQVRNFKLHFDYSSSIIITKSIERYCNRRFPSTGVRRSSFDQEMSATLVSPLVSARVSNDPSHITRNSSSELPSGLPSELSVERLDLNQKVEELIQELDRFKSHIHTLEAQNAKLRDDQQQRIEDRERKAYRLLLKVLNNYLIDLLEDPELRDDLIDEMEDIGFYLIGQINQLAPWESDPGAYDVAPYTPQSGDQFICVRHGWRRGSSVIVPAEVSRQAPKTPSKADTSEADI